MKRPAKRDKFTGRDPVPSWLESALRQLQGLLDLKENWDSYGAPKISIESAYGAIEALREVAPALAPDPAVAPTTTGGVQIEWHRDGIDLEIEVFSRLRAEAYFADSRTGEEWEDDLDSRASEIRQHLGRMIRSSTDERVGSP